MASQTDLVSYITGLGYLTTSVAASTYVPYIGANASLQLGINPVTFSRSGQYGSVYVDSDGMKLISSKDTYFYTDDAGNGTGGYLFLRGTVKIPSFASGKYGIFDMSAIASTDKTFSFPNLSGTLALQGDNISEFTNDAGYITGGTFVSDEAYGVTWNGITTIAPSKNALYAKFESLPGGHSPVTLDSNAGTVLSLSTQQLGLQTQNANTVFAGRATAGTATVPTFRALVAADIPNLSATYLTSYTETDPVVKAINGIVKSNGTTISAATADVDYLTPGTAASTYQTALGFTPENVANKSTNTSLGTSNTYYPTQLAVKTYVDTATTTGARFVTAVNAATTGVLPTTPVYDNGTLGVGATLTAGSNAAFPTIDGVSATLNNLYLVKNEATPANNGAYKLTTVGDGSTKWVLTRYTEYDQSAEIVGGTFFSILAGTTLANTQWSLTTTGAVVVGTTALNYAQLSAALSVTASLGVQKVGTDFRADFVANDGLKLSANSLTVAYDNSSIGIISNLLAVKALGITNAMLTGSIADSKLNQITTASKVSGAALTSLASIPAGAGVIPTVNIGSGTPASGKYVDGATGAWTTIPTPAGINIAAEDVDFLSANRSGTTEQVAQWANMPAAVTELFANTNRRIQVDLTYATDYRIIVYQTTAGYAGADFNIQYSTDQTNWYACDTASAGKVDVGTGTGNKSGSWAPLVAGAKGAVYLRMIGENGNGVADPVFSQIRVQLKVTALTATMIYPASGIVKSTGTGWDTSISGTSAQFVKGDGSLDSSSYLTSLNGAILISQATPQTIGATGTRLAMLWVTDITCTNAITGSVTGASGSCSGNAATATKLAATKNIYGNAFDGSADITAIIASTYGGTGNGFTKFTGPATSEKTFTLPNQNDTVGCLGTAGLWTANQTFAQAALLINNPAGTYAYTFQSAAIAAARKITLPLLTGDDTMATLGMAQKFTQTDVVPRLLSAASYTTDTGTSINCDNMSLFIVTAQTGALLFKNPGGTPADGQKLIITVASSTTAARALTWDTAYGATTVALPTTTAATTATLSIGFIWSASKSLWQCVAVA